MQSRTRARLAAGAVALAAAACASPPPPPLAPHAFRAPYSSGTSERYSAWFADERDGVVYFGLSPFWTALWETGDPAADLRVPGPHWIGRFELASESFLPPLVAREAGPDSRSSVWDVLAHPNGWIYYTTFFEEAGRVHPGTGAVEHFAGVGRGLNELALGPHGRVYATRYGSGLDAQAPRGDGSLVVLSEGGELLREVALHARDGAVTAAKSVAVDPHSGRAIVNADVLEEGREVEFARFVVGRELEIVSGPAFEPELLFVAFAPDGREFSVEDERGRLRLALRGGARPPAALDLGPRAASDFAQDVHVAPDGTAAIAFWSGRVELVREREGRIERATLALEKPPGCAPPDGRSLVYSAFATERAVYATLFCDAVILRAPRPLVTEAVAPGR